ncbi:carbohydrate kinase family protein [Sulfitobacter donghicola]|uniref:Sugar kinase n=1 Tax=Sulfitobacter donghicola DSW-25 = KCTC 12864 = JCM 14565 TaxID=1300350 RepID=A0A073IEC0_9RHOB|nr:sugar kinase [Sulfitobacter donghicola]KEJ88708.1 sugar kinase [Sulfitobacter donghicola DSW-25 = KCTC 12864 = JCM 14565]KIN68482.1 Carbohydrate kinase [Sulfitobacter donghicola DSW-25 = KCTC 12864 = JCM 14565]
MRQNPVIATVGEILVEFVSHQKNCGLKTIADYSGPYPSGAPAIFLDQAARMGARTEMIGGVGDDGFGHAVLDRLNADGVGTRGVTVDDSRSTGTAFVSYYDDGSRDFIFHMAETASDHFKVPQGLLDLGQTILHVSAASLGNARMRGPILETMRAVDAAGGKICCDPNARPELMRDLAARDALEEAMERSTYLMPSTSDLDFLFPDLSEDAAIEKLLQSKAEIIVIKRGAAGATVVSGAERHEFRGHKVEEIDPTGAGDCFGGTFIALLAQGASLFEAGTMANAAGALAVTRRGPMEGNSAPSELARFLDAKKSESAT